MRVRGNVVAWLVVAACVSAPLQLRAEVVEPLAPPVRRASSVGSLTYVVGPDHLAQLTRDDDVLHQRALSWSRRSKISGAVMMGSLAVGALVIIGAATVFSQTECHGNSLGGQVCQSGRPNVSLFAAGLLTAVIGGSVGAALMPSAVEGYDIVNDWNARHPDRTLLVAGRRSGH
jgi:hypothetical protein